MRQRVFQKILFLLLSAVLLATTASAQTLIEWDGGGDGVSWNDANNWNPNNTPNLTTEYARFNGVTVTVNLPAGGITTGGLVIIGTGTVTLTTASGIETLTLSATALGFELDIASTAGLTLLNANLAFGTNVAARINGTLNANSRQLSATGPAVAINIFGTFLTDVAAGFTGSTTTAISNANSPTVTLGTSSTITYSAITSQTISSRSDYANVTLSGGFSAKTADGNLGFVGGGTFTISGALRFDLGAFQISFSGTGGTVIIDDVFRTSNLNGFRGSTSAAISSLNSPTITLGAGSTILYNATSGNQLVSSGSYGFLN
jgi:hypothetical protein